MPPSLLSSTPPHQNKLLHYELFFRGFERGDGEGGEGGEGGGATGSERYITRAIYIYI